MTATDERVIITEPGVYDGVPVEDYHRDPVVGGSLSCSGAKKLLPPSCPAIFRFEQDNPPEPTETFDVGHAAHKLALGVGPEIVVIDAPDWRTVAARDQREAAHADGKVPLLRDTYAQVVAMADALRADPIASLLLGDGGAAEQTLVWLDEPSGIMRRARLDWKPAARTGRTIGVDYKTAKCASPDEFAKSAANYGYDMQAAWYLDGMRALGLAADDAAFVFIVQEKTAPYLVTVAQIDAPGLRIGRHLNRKAITTYARCAVDDCWPGYADDVALISLPYWYERKFEDVI